MADRPGQQPDSRVRPAASAAASPGLEFVRQFTAAAKQSSNGGGFPTQDRTVVSADDVKLPNGFTWHYWHWFIPAEGYLQNFVLHDYVIESTSLSLAAEQSPVGEGTSGLASDLTL
jgi:hypothetical protein